MQGERNGACAAEAKMNVTLFVLLLVLICTVSFGLHEEISESAAKTRPLDLASSSSPESPAVSSFSSSSVSLFSPASFSSINPHVVSAVIFGQEKKRTFEILRDLVKEDVLHLAQEVLGESEGQVAAAEDQGGLSPSVRVGNPSWGPAALRHLARTRVVLGVEGHSLTYFWKRQDPRVVALDETPAVLHIDEEEEEEVVGASLQMNQTKQVADPSKQRVSSVVGMTSCRSCGWLVSVARTR